MELSPHIGGGPRLRAKSSKLLPMTLRRIHRPALGALVVLSAWTLSAQPAPKVTTPKQALGFNIGDDYQVANYYPARSLLAHSGQRIRPHEAGRYRPHGRRPPPVHGRDQFPREPQATRSLQRDFARASRAPKASPKTRPTRSPAKARPSSGSMAVSTPPRPSARSSSWRGSTRW